MGSALHGNCLRPSLPIPSRRATANGEILGAVSCRHFHNPVGSVEIAQLLGQPGPRPELVEPKGPVFNQRPVYSRAGPLIGKPRPLLRARRLRVSTPEIARPRESS